MFEGFVIIIYNYSKYLYLNICLYVKNILNYIRNKIIENIVELFKFMGINFWGLLNFYRLVEM